MSDPFVVGAAVVAVLTPAKRLTTSMILYFGIVLGAEYVNALLTAAGL